jgi:8-oxo-dGTP pyrophosphatase MutT (NUDIX family)
VSFSGPGIPLDVVTERLAAHVPEDPSDLLTGSRAAVASILRFDRGATEVLLMQRAEREGDRWSGQVALPGGRYEEGDEDLLRTAIRETREEVGVDLQRGTRLLGRLGAFRAMAKGKVLPLTITPYVFHLVEDQEVVINAEASAAFWFPLDVAATGALDAPFEYKLGPLPSMTLTSWAFEGRTVWGLTHKILTSLLGVIR